MKIFILKKNVIAKYQITTTRIGTEQSNQRGRQAGHHPAIMLP